MGDDYGLAEATGDVLLSADGLTPESLRVLIHVYSSQYENAHAEKRRDDAELFHAMLRLLCAVRDKRERQWRDMKRSYRNPTGVRTEPYVNI